MKVTSPIIELKGVGPAMVETLNAANIKTILDLLYYLPFKYQNCSQITPICDLTASRELLVCGQVTRAYVQYGPKRSLNVHISDETGSLKIKFFTFYPNMLKSYAVGTQVEAFGVVRSFKGEWTMLHPKITTKTFVKSQHYQAVYNKIGNIGTDKISRLIDTALPLVHDDPIKSLLPDWIWPLPDALRMLHQPPLSIPFHQLSAPDAPARRRLGLEEMIAHFATFDKTPHQSVVGCSDNTCLQTFIDTLPFKLTGAQTRAISDICSDMGAVAMNRLVQGDVGSGKTMVALAAAFVMAKNGGQVALMAPTEILSEQLFVNAEKFLSPLGINVAYLSGNTKAKPRREIEAATKEGSISVLVGTHALFTASVKFAKLALVIVDEQHRFGVEQRFKLLDKAAENRPHQLMMTATPIPRTLTMSLYGHMQTSILDEKPAGRLDIITTAVPKDKMDELLLRMESYLAKGHQIYWVCSLVSDSEEIEAQSAIERHEALRAKLAKWRIGLVHGQLNEKKKQSAMDDFKNKQTHVLVATTVIEVGVDVPDASVIIIEDPNRLGLAQLHQLRGRVGRSDIQSYCILLYQPPLGEQASERLKLMRESTDGFYLAEADLKMRGPGRLLGREQTGIWAMQFADLYDTELVKLAKKIESALSANDHKAILSRYLASEEFLSV